MIASELLSTNGELSHKKRTIQDVIRHLETREDNSSNYSLLLGAGASVTSGIRPATKLIDEWLIELYQRFKNDKPETPGIAKNYFENDHASWFNPINPYSSLFEKRYDLPSQRRRFVEREVDKKLPSIGYAYLTALAGKNVINTIFTTNFDDLINEAFYQFSNSRPVMCAHDSSIHSISITSKRPKIIKLHGDYLFDGIKSTLKETESLEQNIKEKLMEFCKEFGLIVIGYAGNDRSIMDIIEFLVKQDNYLKNGIYWCLRPNDEVSTQLRNLLWKDRVYPVLIDGFDEFLAEVHNEILGCDLDINANAKESKLQKTIENILDDKYSLSSNPIISNEINKIKHESRKHDISTFLNDLSKDDQNEQIGIFDIRNMLEVQKLIKELKHRDAYELCEKYLRSASSDSAKARFIVTLIEISKDIRDDSKAMVWAERLIEIDPFNVEYHLTKLKCIKDDSRRYKLAIEKSEQFPYSPAIYNLIVDSALKLIKSNDLDSAVNIKDVHGYCDKSIQLEPSLSNRAWLDKVRLIKNEKKTLVQPNVLNDVLAKHVGKARATNPEHITTLQLTIDEYLCTPNPMVKFKGFVSELYEMYEKSSAGKKKRVLSILSDVFSSFDKIEWCQEGYDLKSKFYEQYCSDEKINDIPEVILSKCEYLIGNGKEEDAILIFERIWENSSDLVSHMSGVFNIASIISPEKISKLNDVIDKNRFDIVECYYHDFKSDYFVNLRNYDEAMKSLESAFVSGLSLHSYLCSMSYVYLLMEKYEELIRFGSRFKKHLEYRNDSDEAFIINYNYALKRLGKDIDLVTLRNITAKSSDDGVKMCAFILLDQSVDVKRLMKSSVQKSKMKYYAYRKWPLVPKSILEECKRDANYSDFIQS